MTVTLVVYSVPSTPITVTSTVDPVAVSAVVVGITIPVKINNIARGTIRVFMEFVVWRSGT